jgi:DNA-binding winged helix-turn-helix (wHTH) protein
MNWSWCRIKKSFGLTKGFLWQPIYLFIRVMDDHKYLISGRFLVDLQLNSVKDEVTGVEHRLEPRLIAVLFELLRNPEALVTREALIQKIWNDYPGAEDGLNQAISSLRRFLSDETKEVIRTVPKKGYMLMAPVVKQTPSPAKPRKSRNKVFVYVAVIGLAFIFIIVLLSVKHENEPLSVSKTNDTEVDFPSLEVTEESNHLNTITTTDSLGNRYRLVMIGDRRPKFYVNDSIQINMEPYTVLIDKLAKELWRRQKEAESK